MPDFQKPATVITVSCLSGGSGKTTTCLNLATMLAQRGKTLAIDLDPQGNLSQWLGWTDLSEEATVAESLLPGNEGIPLAEIIKAPCNENREDMLAIAPADYSLARAAEIIAPSPGRELFLKRALKPIINTYEFIVIDSPPAKGLLTYNAILAADFLVIPTECTNKGVVGAANTLVLIQELAEIEFSVPKILGIIPIRDQWSGANQTRMSKAALAALTEALPNIPIFSSVRQSTIVQQTNHAGWSLQEVGENSLALAYTEVIDHLMEALNHG
ncbi:MAG: ParA family protein [Snowella sp.]|nr:ParA family protein [Snowella sp.]